VYARYAQRAADEEQDRETAEPADGDFIAQLALVPVRLDSCGRRAAAVRSVVGAIPLQDFRLDRPRLLVPVISDRRESNHTCHCKAEERREVTAQEQCHGVNGSYPAERGKITRGTSVRSWVPLLEGERRDVGSTVKPLA